MEYKLELNTELRFEVESDASVVLEVSYLFIAHHSAGLNSTRPTQVVWWGKLDPRSDSPARRSGCPANFIAITLFNLDIETKKILIFQTRFDVITVYFSHPFYFRLHPLWLFKVAVNYVVIQKVLLRIQWIYLLISILMLG